MKIGILRESSKPNDRRVPIVPKDVKELIAKNNKLQFYVQPSVKRIFSNSEYRKVGATIQDDLSNCDFLFGVKEVLPSELIPEKHYFFFAHIGKGQSYHQKYISQLTSKKITLTDYEYLVDEKGKRTTAFGHWAGMIGLYYALIAIGKRYGAFDLNTANHFNNHIELFNSVQNIALPNIKLLITGKGNAAKGATELLEQLLIKKVNIKAFLSQTFKEAVYTQLSPADYVTNKEGRTFNREHFFTHPNEYTSSFLPFLKKTDVFVPCHYWHPDSPHFFSLRHLKENNIPTKIIADVTCDLNGPIPTTIRSTSFKDPFFDFDPIKGTAEIPFSNSDAITVMAIDNLPAALPKEASEFFSNQIRTHVLKCLINRQNPNSIIKATLIDHGKLTNHFLRIK